MNPNNTRSCSPDDPIKLFQKGAESKWFLLTVSFWLYPVWIGLSLGWTLKCGVQQLFLRLGARQWGERRTPLPLPPWQIISRFRENLARAQFLEPTNFDQYLGWASLTGAANAGFFAWERGGAECPCWAR
jgi:hypothetical protein